MLFTCHIGNKQINKCKSHAAPYDKKKIKQLNHIMLGSLLLARSAGQARLFEKKKKVPLLGKSAQSSQSVHGYCTLL